MAVDIGNDKTWLMIAVGEDGGKVVDGKVDMPAPPAQRIDHLMARDRPQPWAEERIFVPTLPLEVNSEQSLLYNVLGVGVRQARAGQPRGARESTAITIADRTERRRHCQRASTWPIPFPERRPAQISHSLSSELAARALHPTRDFAITFLLERKCAAAVTPALAQTYKKV